MAFSCPQPPPPPPLQTVFYAYELEISVLLDHHYWHFTLAVSCELAGGVELFIVDKCIYILKTSQQKTKSHKNALHFSIIAQLNKQWNDTITNKI